MKITEKLKNKWIVVKNRFFKIGRDVVYELAILASAHYLYVHFF
ncbi:hypothetical protein [Enterococcus sp. LJL120]